MPDRNEARAPAASGSTSGAAVVLLAVLVLVGFVLRLVIAHDAPLADELSTFWIVDRSDLGRVLSIVHSDAEITPPLFFVLAWLGRRLGDAPVLVRLPSLLAGVATIPLVYAIGLRTLGRRAALAAAALTTVAPFMIYYSAEARGYGVMVFAVALSTLALLLAVDTGRRRWWVVYAAAVAAAAYSHYTCAFVLVVQFAWVWIAHPAARRPALVASLAAAVALAPWASGLHADLASPTGKILTAITPFNPHAVRIALEHWTIGYPYGVVGLGVIPGIAGLVLLGVAVLVAAGAGARRLAGAPVRPSLTGRPALLVALALATPVGSAVVSAFSTHLFGTRNLAASWPGFVLCLAGVLVAAGRRLGPACAVLATVGLGIGAIKMLEPVNRRPHATEVAHHVEALARPGDVVVDGTGRTSPGPLTSLDLLLPSRLRVVRVLAPAERVHPFNVYDRTVPFREGFGRAARGASHGRVIVAAYLEPPAAGLTRLRVRSAGGRRTTWVRASRRVWESRTGDLAVDVWTRAG